MFYIYWILAGLGVVLLIMLVVIALRPNEFTVSRSSVFNLPPEKVFGHVNDFHAWEAWSPWAKMDPHSVVTFEGTPAGKGAIFTWKGNKKVGEGRMTILDSEPPKLVRLKLEFIKPFPNTATTVFTFEPQGSGGGATKVTWTMTGKSNFMSKAFCMVINMDKMVGGDFERGLASMKTVAETAPS